MAEVCIPLDIVCDILSQFPMEDIAHYKSVCKAWGRLTWDSHFIKMQKDRALSQPRRFLLAPNPLNSLFLMEETDSVWKGREIFVKNMSLGPEYRVVGSCNGFVCLASPYVDNSVYIYNPITGESVELAKRDANGCNVKAVYGFGFDCVSEKYKVVCVWCPHYWDDDLGEGDYIEEQVATLCEIIEVGESTWRRIEIPYQLELVYIPETLFVDGMFYWIVETNNAECLGAEIILGLDIHDEKFHTIDSPSDDFQHDGFFLANIAESLATVEAGRLDESYRIWHIKGSKMNEDWEHRYTHRVCVDETEDLSELSCRRLTKLNDGRFLYQARNYSQQSDHLVIYDPQQGTSSLLKTAGIPSSFDVHSFVPTLVSPSSIVCTGERIMNKNSKRKEIEERKAGDDLESARKRKKLD